MTGERIKLLLTEQEQNLLINSLLGFRNDLINEDLPIEDVNDLILKIADAPLSKERFFGRDAR